MTIRPVKPGGWAKGMVPRAAELAQIDERLSTFGLDSEGPDTVTGVLSLTQDPAHPGTHPQIVTGAGSTVQVTNGRVDTKNGGRFILGDGDVPEFVSPVTRRVRISSLEACRSAYTSGPAGNSLSVVGGIGITSAVAGSQDVTFALPKPHDGATLTSLKVWLYFTDPSVASISYTAILTRVTAATGVASTVVMGTASATASYSAIPQAVTLSGLVSNVIDLSTYDYSLFWRSPLLGVALTAIELNFGSIGDEGFTQ